MNDETIKAMAYTTYGNTAKADTLTYALIQDALTKVRGRQRWIYDVPKEFKPKEVTVEDVFREMDNEIN